MEFYLHSPVCILGVCAWLNIRTTVPFPRLAQVHGVACDTLWETGEVHTEFWWGDPRDRDHSEDLGVNGRITIKLIIKNHDAGALSGSIRLRTGTGGGRL